MSTPNDRTPDPNEPPAYTPPPAYGQVPAYGQAPAYGQQYGTAPQAPYGAPVPGAPVPGKTLGIVAFILSFFMQVVALILGIIALVQSRKAGVKNGFALAAIIVSSVLLVVGIIVGIILIASFSNLANEIVTECSPGGSGIVHVWGQPVPCSEIDTSGY